MLLKSQKLIFLTRSFFQLYRVIESSELHVSKARRIISNSGCLIAGCCFSRQSDEEPFLSTAGENNFLRNKIIEENDHLRQRSSSEGNLESTIMKRGSELNDNEISQDSNLRYEQTEPNKRRKFSDEKIENEVNVEIKVPHSSIDVFCSVSESKREGKDELPKTEKREPPKKLRPNYFVAVKISNQEIHENLKKIQDHILEKESNLKRSMIELKTLHITLMVMHIGDAQTHARAMNALRSVHQEYDKEMSDNPLELEFKGLGHFQNRVLFAKLSSGDSYERLCNLAEGVKKNFAANAVFSTDKRDKFTPHLTVAKIDFKKKQNKFIKKIDPELYKDYVNQHFGSQVIESIQLLSMTDPKNEEGYYSGDEIYFSSFDQSNDMNSLCELLEVDKKKKDIKDIINSLMKEKLK